LQAHVRQGVSLLYTGDIAEARVHLEQAIALYDPAEHRSLATRFGGQDAKVHALSCLSWALWLPGYPEAALVASHRALSDAREIGQVTTLMTTLALTTFSFIFGGDYATAKTQSAELILLADAKSGLYWKPLGILNQGWLLALTGKASNAVELITSGITAYRLTGSTNFIPLRLSHLASASAEIGQADEAWRSVGEAMTTMETSKERWLEAEVNRIAGEIALKSPKRDGAQAEAYFERIRLFQIARVESLREPPVNRSQQFAFSRHRAPTTSKVPGVTQRHEPRTPLARPGQGKPSTAAGGVGVMKRLRGQTDRESYGGHSILDVVGDLIAHMR
jgi:predicted ATPase